MNETKLSSDEVPAKFVDWLLAMGCPPEKVPTVDKISQMCRGTYYLVWRSLMEQVESKDIIKQKRLQVFADDVRRCKKKNLFTEHDTNVLIPPELTLWKQQTDVRRKVAEAETRVTEAQRTLHEVMDKVSSKMDQRNIARHHIQSLQRRAWLLQLVAEDLESKKRSLAETRTIAEEVCRVNEDTDVKDKLDKCLQSPARAGAAAPAGAAVASSTMLGHTAANSVLTADVDEEHIASLSRCRGDVLWSELYSRRAALVASLGNCAETAATDRPGSQSVVVGTAALQCSLALEALKCREMARLAQTRLGRAVNELNSQLTSESCELLVLRCERARVQARVGALRALLGDAGARRGAFSVARGDGGPAASADIHRVDRAIESKKDEIKSMVSSLAATERKIQNARECLAAIFNGFHKDAPVEDFSTRGIQLDLPSESAASLRQFYEQRRSKRTRMELSMEFDKTDSFDCSDINNARYIDELRVYLKKFNLEKNRKLVLESGQKIWVFETLQASAQRLAGGWHAAGAAGLPRGPAGLRALSAQASLRDSLRAMRRRGRELDLVFDFNKHTDEEERIIDSIKKRLDENLRSLQKTSKTLDQGRENLTLWSDNKIKNQISHQRTVDGKPYKAYEAYYLESLNF